MENSYPLPRKVRASIPRRSLRSRPRVCAAPFDLTLLDTAVREFCLEDPGAIANTIKIAGRYGIKRHVLIPAFALCWAMGRRNGDPDLEHTGKVGLTGVVATALVSEAIKRQLCRSRPVDCGDAGEWGTEGARSFPSGHAGTAFATATAIACTAGDRRIGAAAFATAGVLAGGRVIADRHWTSDIMAGAVLGTAVTALAAYWLNRRRET
jgi:membrane-associated phospholipid phosphatase